MLMAHGMQRTFLKGALLSVLATALCSCVSVPKIPSEPQPFTFVQMCDTHIGARYEHHLKTFSQAVVQVNDLEPDFVVICGDLVARAYEKSVIDFNRIKAELKMPCHIVPGNHDVFWGPHDRHAGLSQQQSLEHYRTSFGHDYYAFEHKGYMFICVNTPLWQSVVDLKDEQAKHDKWLAEALVTAAKRGLPIFIITHHPLYVKSPNEPDGYSILPSAKRNELLALFEKHGVVAVLSGHAHRVIINDYNGIQLVAGETTSRTHGSPLGFRMWHIGEQRPFTHVSVPLEGL
jgi:serine/threonine-protein phosphatase CPPED1